MTFAIYELKDGATNPADGTMLYRTSRNFEHAGFHRLDLDWAIDVKAGKKIAVVSTASTLSGDGTRLYSASANQAISKQSVEYLNGRGVPVPLYGEAVVNEGESFLYRDENGNGKDDGEWVDWTEHIAALPKSTEEVVPGTGIKLPGNTYIEQYSIDNFSIKLYAEPIQIAEEAPADLSAAEVTVAKATYNGGKAVKPRVTVKLDGTTLTEGTDYTLSYKNNKKAGTAVAIVKGVGTYTGSAAQTFTIAKAKNTLVAKAKSKTNKVKWARVETANRIIKRTKAFKVSKAKGTVTYKKASGNKKITVSKAGKITLKKGLQKGTYTVKVKVTAAGNANYKKATKTVKLKIKVA